MAEELELPRAWKLTENQDFIIGSLADDAGTYITTYEFCEELYGGAEKGMPAPAKLRVLIQRCREILDERTEGRVEIESKRGSGWIMTRKNAARLRNIVDPE